ncbi:MAG: S1 RNA-binding domain-containing protein [Thermoguttaceae bacterium]|nr:S1 RNA-binding domain-containing protein [Thermoguttaceae bacterium]
MSAEKPENNPESTPPTPETAPLKPAPPRRKILIGTQRPGALEAHRAEVARAAEVKKEAAPAPVAQAQPEVVEQKSEVQPEPVAEVKPEVVEPKPEVQPEPVAEVKPEVVEPKPEVKPEPVAEVKPEVVEQKPVVQPEPVTEVKPEVVEQKPAIQPEPVAEVKPEVVEQKPEVKGESKEDRRDGRGKKREPRVSKAQQILAAGPVGKVSKIPVPNQRLPLSDELQAEYEAALGDLAEANGFDSVINNDTVKVGVEFQQDDKVEATVERISREDVILDLGNFTQGVASLRQFSEVPTVGTKVKVSIVRFNESEGLYEVTLPYAAAIIGDWSEVQEGMVVDALVTGQNTGGLECEVAHIRAFMPAGQVSIYHRDSFDDLINTHLMAVVLEAKPEKRNLVISHKAYEFRQQEAEKKEFLANLKEGDVFDAVVRKIMPFGCFVDLGHGVEGLVHISRLSWGHVTDPNEVVKEGEMIKVMYLKTDDKGKLSFSRRETMASPWETAPVKYAVNTVCTAKIVKIEQFGAFCELEPGVEGLLHISELAHQRVGHVSDIVRIGQEVQVQVISMDPLARKIGLSIKALIAPPAKEESEEDNPGHKKKKENPEDLEAKPLAKKYRNKKTDNLRGGTTSSSGSKWATDFSALLGNVNEED